MLKGELGAGEKGMDLLYWRAPQNMKQCWWQLQTYKQKNKKHQRWL